MASSEAAWHALYNRLGEVLGPDHADTLMSNLATKDDIALLATKEDLRVLRADMNTAIADLKADLTTLLLEQTRSQNRLIVTSMVGLTAVFSFVQLIIG